MGFKNLYYIDRDYIWRYTQPVMTGHYIDWRKDAGGGFIYGPRGYSEHWLDDRGYIYSPKGYTQCYVQNKTIYGPEGVLTFLDK